MHTVILKIRRIEFHFPKWRQHIESSYPAGLRPALLPEARELQRSRARRTPVRRVELSAFAGRSPLGSAVVPVTSFTGSWTFGFSELLLVTSKL